MGHTAIHTQNDVKWKALSRNYITYTNITNGGTLALEMGSQPNKTKGIADGDKPFSLSALK